MNYVCFNAVVIYVSGLPEQTIMSDYQQQITLQAYKVNKKLHIVYILTRIWLENGV